MRAIETPAMSGWIPGAEAAILQLDAIAPVVLLGPTPTFPHIAELCLESAFFDPSACSRPIDEVVPPGTLAAAQELAASTGADFLDLNGILCDSDGTCPMIVDDTIMYRDAGHISNAYSTHFATIFGDVFAAYLD